MITLVLIVTIFYIYEAEQLLHFTPETNFYNYFVFMQFMSDHLLHLPYVM